MSNFNDLTILLTTKGRDRYTLRWLWYANYINFPYPIYIADGEPKKSIINLLKNKNNFPNITYSHNLYNDKTYKDYYEKLAISISEIETKYVMLSDNDDFLLLQGISNCINFLNINHDFIGASGRIGFVDIYPSFNCKNDLLSGDTLFYFSVVGGYSPLSKNEDSLIERIQKAAENYTVIYYSIFRKQNLENALKKNLNANFHSTVSFEIFLYFNLIKQGKINFDSNMASYIRQIGTSNGGAIENIPHQIVSGNLNSDYSKIMNIIAHDIDMINQDSTSLENYIKFYLEKHLASRIDKSFNNQFLNDKESKTNKIIKYTKLKIKYLYNKYFINDMEKANKLISNNEDLIKIKKMFNDVDYIFYIKNIKIN